MVFWKAVHIVLFLWVLFYKLLTDQKIQVLTVCLESLSLSLSLSLSFFFFLSKYILAMGILKETWTVWDFTGAKHITLNTINEGLMGNNLTNVCFFESRI